MPIPAGITSITVTGKYLAPDGSALSGYLVFTPSIKAADSTDNAIIPSVPYKVTLDANGAFSVAMAATDDAQWNAPGWTYQVTEVLTDSSGQSHKSTYNIEVPAASAGGTLDLADAVVVDLPGTPSQYLLKAGGTMTGDLILSGAGTDLSVGGTATVTDRMTVGSGALAASNRLYVEDSSATAQSVLLKATAAGTASAAVLGVETFSNAKRALDIRVTGDSVARFRVDYSAGSGGGTITFGNGTSADTNLYRNGADELKTDDAFTAAGNFRAMVGAQIDSSVGIGTTAPSNARLSIVRDSASRRGVYIANTGTTGSNESIYVENTSALATSVLMRSFITGEVNSRFLMMHDGGLQWGSGAGSTDTRLYRSAADSLATDDDFLVNVAGKGIRVKEGSNAKMGTSTLVAGTITVSNTSVTANSRILLSVQSLGTVTAPKPIAVTARTASTSFTITSSDNTDTSVVAWHIIEPA